jgi:1-acyl-sn-glycerol-3-phosphate acyltransferase
MFFYLILRSKDFFLFKPNKSFDKVTTVITWIISVPVFIFLGITGSLFISLPIKNIIYKVMWTISIVVLFILGVRLDFDGEMPKGQVIVIANHCSWIDDALNSIIMSWFKWKVVYAEEVTRIFLASFFLKYIGVPINRTDEKSRKMVFRSIIVAIKEGYNILMYPEGRRLPTDKGEDQYLLPFEDGAFALSKLTGKPIQPVIMSWTYLFKPRSGQWWYSPRTIRIYWLKPMTILPGETIQEFNKRVWNIMDAKIRASLGV